MDMSDAPDSADTPTQQTYLQRVREGEHLAFWKLALRAITCVLAIIGIGCAGWTLSNQLSFQSNPYIGYFGGGELSPFVLAVCGISFLFGLACILVLLLRKPPGPLHPGLAVGIDLILWLAFIVTALFTTASIFSLASFGDDPTYLDDPSYGNEYSGNYYLATNNNTWVYNVTSVYSSSSTSNYNGYFWNSTRDDWQLNRTTPSVASVDRDCTPYFDSCAEQDAYVNKLWRTKSQREGTVITSAAAQWLLVLFHFALFVWACVDTHRRNAGLKQRKVNAVADRVIQDMQARGLITVHGAGGRDGQEGQALMSGGNTGQRPMEEI